MKTNSGTPFSKGLRNRCHGFLLAELMIVIAIIAIIAAIAIPNLLSARASANGRSAIDSMRTMFTAQEEFKENDLDENGDNDYADELSKLYDAGGLIDEVLATGKKQGYKFDLQSIDKTQWSVIATPASPLAGELNFYVDQNGRIFRSVCGNGIVEPGEDCDPGGADTMGNCVICDRGCRCSPDNPPLYGPTSMLALRSYYESELADNSSNLIWQLLELAPETSVAGAMEMLKSPQTVKQILRLLDADNDGSLSLNEITMARILTLAKIIARSCSVKGPDLGIDEAQMETMIDSYQEAIIDAMEFDPMDQEQMPRFSLKNQSIEPAIQLLRYFPTNLENFIK